MPIAPDEADVPRRRSHPVTAADAQRSDQTTTDSGGTPPVTRCSSASSLTPTRNCGHTTGSSDSERTLSLIGGAVLHVGGLPGRPGTGGHHSY